MESRMIGRLVFACLLACVAAATLLRAAETLRILPLVRDDQVVVSFELADAYTAEVQDAISSGLRTTFTYTIELRMAVPAWIDRTVASAIVTTIDQYDNLTRRHALSRTVDGQVVEDLVTEDQAIVKNWLTSWTRLPLVETSRLDASRDYYVRVSARARPLGASLLGWANAVTGQAKFTYVP
jgi:hypothetical protein